MTTSDSEGALKKLAPLISKVVEVAVQRSLLESRCDHCCASRQVFPHANSGSVAIADLLLQCAVQHIAMTVRVRLKTAVIKV